MGKKETPEDRARRLHRIRLRTTNYYSEELERKIQKTLSKNGNNKKKVISLHANDSNEQACFWSVIEDWYEKHDNENYYLKIKEYECQEYMEYRIYLLWKESV